MHFLKSTTRIPKKKKKKKKEKYDMRLGAGALHRG